eukprot:Trichotokara_eunicae@DN5009_c0_g1_i1.p1
MQISKISLLAILWTFLALFSGAYSQQCDTLDTCAKCTRKTSCKACATVLLYFESCSDSCGYLQRVIEPATSRGDCIDKCGVSHTVACTLAWAPGTGSDSPGLTVPLAATVALLLI